MEKVPINCKDAKGWNRMKVYVKECISDLFGLKLISINYEDTITDANECDWAKVGFKVCVFWTNSDLSLPL